MKQVFMIIMGIIIGILSKYGDIAYANTIFSTFGLISSGLLIWLVICVMIMYKSKNKKDLTILLISFMLPMLLSYYLYSIIIVKYFYFKIFVFWIIMFVVSLILENILFSIRDRKIFKFLFVIVSIIMIIFDAFKINGFEIGVMFTEAILVIITLKYMCKKKI